MGIRSWRPSDLFGSRPFGLAFLALILIYVVWSCYTNVKDTHQREQTLVEPVLDSGMISEEAYIQDTRRGLFEVEWEVKLLTADEVYDVGWQEGFSGFEDNEGVELIHKIGSIYNNNNDHLGYLVGLPGRNKGKVAFVWITHDH